MRTASKASAARTPEVARHLATRVPAVAGPIVHFPCLSPAADVDAEIQPSSALAEAVSNTFGANLAREIEELRGYAVWLCDSKSLADDLIQDTLLRAWAARDSFQAGTNLKAWCTTILRNVFISYKRRSWRWQSLPDNVVEGLTIDSADAEHRLDLLALRNAIALLPLEQREAILLVCVSGQSYSEAAEVCACAAGTVKSRVSRARIRLAALMSDRGASFNADRGLQGTETLYDLLSQASLLKTRGKALM